MAVNTLPENDSKRTSLNLDPVLWKRVKVLAIEQDTTAQSIVEYALYAYLAKYEKAD